MNERPAFWIPRPSDIEWQRRLINKLNDGGVWGIPENGTVYRINKVERTLTCINGPKDSIFDKLTEVCRYLNYKTVYKTEPMTPQQITEAMKGTGKSIERIVLPSTEL